jgi:hypothetical protein
MFYNKTYRNKDIVIVPKSNDGSLTLHGFAGKNSLKTLNKVDVKPNNNKTYDNIRNIVQNDDKPVEINSIPTKKNFSNLKII